CCIKLLYSDKYLSFVICEHEESINTANITYAFLRIFESLHVLILAYFIVYQHFKSILYNPIEIDYIRIQQ
ncbi:MAG: hypothetical protein LBR10_06510, partial [Prevotellaceae bacterium]|nr:hypothetical protein [Prevotellaceae bacterium]